MKTGFFALSEADRPELIAHFLRLSPEDRRLRFNVAMPDAPLRAWCERLDLSMVTGFFNFGRLTAVALLCPEGTGVSEFAISVDASSRGHGLAGQLLAESLRQHSLHRVVIRHSADNRAMARVHSRYPSRRQLEDGEVDVTLDVERIRDEELRAIGLACAAEA